MTLPSITAPAGTPVFLAEGHDVEGLGPFAQVQFTVGHRRARRVHTATERIVSVSWLLRTSQLAAVDDWFEDDLEAGTLPFAAQVAREDGSGLAWWHAQWVRPYQTELLHLGRARIRGALLLTGTRSLTGP